MLLSLWNRKVVYHVQKSPHHWAHSEPAGSSSPYRSLSTQGLSWCILPLTPSSSQWSLTFRPPNQNPVSTTSLPHACHMSRPHIFLDLVTLTIFGEEYRLWISSFCNFLHHPPSLPLGRNVFLNTLLSETLSLCSKWEITFFTHTAQMAKLQFCIF
jgi:hypothetical protein